MDDWIWQLSVAGAAGGGGIVGWLVRQQAKLREDFQALANEQVKLKARVEHMPDRAAHDRWTERLASLEGDYKAQSVHLGNIDGHLGEVADNVRKLLLDRAGK